jgi:hypothetical protein
MNEQLQQKMLEWANSVEAMTSKEFPLFIHDYLLYKGIGFGFSILSAALIIAFLFLVIRKTTIQNTGGDKFSSKYLLFGAKVDYDVLVFVRMISFSVMIFPVVTMWLELCSLVQLIFSPRAFILMEFLHRQGG